MSRIGVDIGGTFTDIVWIDSQGQVRFDKAFSTPHALYQGVLEGIRCLAPTEKSPDLWLCNAERFAHGTTASTNALLERKGAKVGLITTKGFEDTLVIGRATVARTGGLPVHQAMDFTYTVPPPPLVPRNLVRGIDERVTASGESLLSINRLAVKDALHELVDMEIESLAVALLWSFRNPSHELIVREIAKEIAPEMPVSISSEIAPHIGEFERMITTVANAYVAPISNRYLQDLEQGLKERGFNGPIHVMTATGGTILPTEVDAMAVSLINSGPVGGIIAAKHLGENLGWNKLITADMGGTSFDVGIVDEGKFEIEENPFLAHGLPSKIPAVKIVTIGAGGGSISWTDGHRLFVGPESAGSDPGPACYGLGGDQPTVTDALVALGILHPQRFFGGRRELDLDAALTSIEKKIANPLSMDVYQAANGIYQVVTSRMADLIRKASIEQGNDPRTFKLCAYGGAAGAHAALLMEQLRIPVVIIPYAAPVFSAMGISLSDILYSASKAFPIGVDPNSSFSSTVKRAFEDLVTRVERRISASGIDRQNFVFSFELDIRYTGQINSVTVSWDRPSLEEEDVPKLREAFQSHYEKKFGKGSIHDGAPLELIGYRLYALSPQTRPALAKVDAPRSRNTQETRKVYGGKHGWITTDVVGFEELPIDYQLTGPAIIERNDTTIWIPVSFKAMRDAFGNVIISHQEKSGENG